MEAGNPQLPLMEKLHFLSIYSSNLDEFYKVRIPALLALHKVDNEKWNISGQRETLQEINTLIDTQQELFGKTLSAIIPELQQKNIFLHYKNISAPSEVQVLAREYFYQHILTYLVRIPLNALNKNFFPVNNQLYFLLQTTNETGSTDYFILNIPSNKISRFFTATLHGKDTHILFIDDIIAHYIGELFTGYKITHISSFKITRDADLNLDDDYEGDLLTEIETLIQHRNAGLATRLLHAPQIPPAALQYLVSYLHLEHANIIEGGTYHHLSDLDQVKVDNASLYYPKWQERRHRFFNLLNTIEQKDIVLHTPFDSYNTVLQFFNEAAFDFDVTEIYVTLYRVAKKSAIVESLISAARNGKKVYVLIELKARFDEENNIKWAKKLTAAGVKVVYSKANLKVHAKIALVRKRSGNNISQYGIFATGNFNEVTAKFYTDHMLLTHHAELLRELYQLFRFLVDGETNKESLVFNHLLVSPFNLQEAFFKLIDQEIENAAKGLPASIIIKLNNLEEKKLIRKLEEAAERGVLVKLIVRSICCINPNQHQQLSVRRVVDRFLEHGRVFLFHQNGNPKMFMGSSDWMNRNIYKRIEVCVPVLDPVIHQTMQKILDTYWNDTVQGVSVSTKGKNLPDPDHFHTAGTSAQMRIQTILN